MNLAASTERQADSCGSSFWLLVVFLYAPILILGIFSFNDRDVVSFPWQGFTTRWYEGFFDNPQLLDALRDERVDRASSPSIITTVLAIPAAIALQRRAFRGKAVATRASCSHRSSCHSSCSAPRCSCCSTTSVSRSDRSR